MRDKEVAPDPHLMESMRAVGYTLETAIADIVDNSITAGATQVDIRFAASPQARIGIIDNGSGMDEVELVQAMRLAGRPPSTVRGPNDLGRFGLGLKTASLSQARSVTVISKQGADLKAVQWDLDHLATTGRWALQILNASETQGTPWLETLNHYDSGTMVLWEKLDQLHAPPDQLEWELDARMATARSHLALVFHRFADPVTSPRAQPLTIRINGATIPRVDPFLTHHKGTQTGQRERIRVGNVWVNVQPYTLPYVSKLRASDKETAQIAGTLRDSQGFYIYRAGRLVLWGTWFKIIPRDELGKLARVQVDVPNTLDHLWALDIKKSSTAPPPEVRRRLAQIAGRIVGPSRRAHKYRGRADDPGQIRRLWTLIHDRDTFHYEINASHPLVATMSEQLDPSERRMLQTLLRAIEASFPVEDAYVRLGSDNTHLSPAVLPAELAELVRSLYATTGRDPKDLARDLATVEPFSTIPNLESFIREAVNV